MDQSPKDRSPGLLGSRAPFLNVGMTLFEIFWSPRVTGHNCREERRKLGEEEREKGAGGWAERA